MVPFVLSVASRWYSRSRGTAHIAVPAALAAAALLVGGWEMLRRPLVVPPGAAGLVPGDTAVVFGPQRFDAPRSRRGDAATTRNHFPTRLRLPLAVAHRYVVRVTNGNADGAERVASGSIDGHALDLQTAVQRFDLTAQPTMVLDIALDAQLKAGHVTVEVLDVTGGAVLVFGMERFTRRGAAARFSRTFRVEDHVAAPFHLWVVNGGPGGTITLNGEPVAVAIDAKTGVAVAPVTPVRGDNTLEIELAGGVPGSVDVGITALDISPPLLTIGEPAPGLITRDTVVTVSGTVTDGLATVLVNGRVAARSGTTYSAAVPLAEGANAITVAAENAVGVRVDSLRDVVRDRTTPLLVLAAPTDAFVTERAAITVSGTVQDAHAVTVNANGVPFAVRADGAFTGQLPLAAGRNVVSVTAADVAGNTSAVVRLGTKASGVVLVPTGPMNLTSSVVAQDAFTGTGALSGDWTGFDTPPVRSRNLLKGDTEDNALAFWNADSFSDNQYSQIVLGEDATEIGVAVRVSGSAMANANAYWAEYRDSTEIGVHKLVAGVLTPSIGVLTGLSLHTGDTLRLEVLGTTLRVKVNGEQLGPDLSDVDLGGGAAGIATGNTTATADNWEGGDVIAEAGDAFAQEPFTGSGALSGDWTTLGTAAVRADDMLRGNSVDSALAFWDAESFAADQYSQIVLGANPAEVGVAVRVSGSTMANASAYFLEYHDSSELRLRKVVSGAMGSDLAVRSGLLLEEGDIMRLEVRGTTLRIRVNGAQLGQDVSDASIPSGAVGFFVADTTTHQADAWEGGNLPFTGVASGYDAFTGTGLLATTWRAFDTAAVRDDDMVRGDNSDNNLAYWNAAWFTPNQFSQIVLGTNPPELGAAVRITGTAIDNASAYWVEYVDSTEVALSKYVEGELTASIATRTGLTLVEGDTVRLEVEGTTLRIKVNGVQLGASIEDGDIASGAAGFLTGTFDGHQGDDWQGGDLGPLDPSTVATPISQNTAVPLYTSTSFLYTGDNPIQTGVEPGTITPLRAAVLRGRVFTRDGGPLAGVTIQVLDHDELGQTLTRADGRFDMAVNGGGVLTLDYQKAGYLPVQRPVPAPWQDFAIVDEAIMVQLDTAVTTIDFSDAVQVARGSVVSDTDGTRRATALFFQGTIAEMMLPGGEIDTLTSLDVRLTEYTVGPNGPGAMPGILPPTSSYTYAVELSSDEAIAAGATGVRFTQPVVTYVENFLDFPVGVPVPIGSYDRVKGVWVPEPNGRIVKVLSVSGDTANLDIDGDAAADDSAELAAIGITPGERLTLADLYSAGQTLWRTSLSHFTPVDNNWPTIFPNYPDDPLLDGGGDQRRKAEQVDNPKKKCGSIIDCQNQVLGETIGLVGTPFTLNYRSNRVPGFSAALAVDIRLTRFNVPSQLLGVEVRINVAGRDTAAVFPAAQYQTFHYRWDGRDAYGRFVSGRHLATYSITYVYSMTYLSLLGSGRLFGQYCSRVVDDTIIPCDSAGTVSPQRFVRYTVSNSVWLGPIAAWNAVGQGVGGWSLDAHHAYDPWSRLLYLGNGERVEARDIRQGQVVAGGAETAAGNGGAATAAGFANLADVVVAPDGGFYLSDPVDHTVRHVRADGAIEAFAGMSGSQGFSGDGGRADSSQLDTPRGLALGLDGSLYIADVGNYRVRRVTPQGTIETFAGTGSQGFAGDGGKADSADLSNPVAVVAAPDGSVYVADIADTARIRKISTDGRITTVAGAGTNSETCRNDSIPAAATCFPTITDIAWGPDNALYVLEGPSLRRIDPDGITSRVAGDSSADCTTEPGDGASALNAGLCATSVAVAPNGDILVADNDDYLRAIQSDGIIRRVASGPCAYDAPIQVTRLDRAPIMLASATLVLPVTSEPLSPCLSAVALAPDASVLTIDPGTDPDTSRVYRIQSALPGLLLSTFVVASPAGDELFVFDADGRHIETRDALTATTILSFAYDSGGRLISITDADSNVTTIERDGSGVPSAVVGPFGQENEIGVDSLGYLSSVTNPAGETIAVSQDESGLLQRIVNAMGDTTSFAYDDDGLLSEEDDAAGGVTELDRAELGTDLMSFDTTTVTLTSAENHATRYETVRHGKELVVRTVLPSALAELITIVPNGGKGLVTTITERPDSMVTTVTTRRDPRFPASAFLDSMQIYAPNGTLISEMRGWRSANLSDPDDPLSLVSQTDSVRVNGNTTASVYTASTRRQVTTTPESRIFVTRLDSVGRVVEAQATNLDSVLFSYDGRGRLEEQQQGGRIVSYAYDSSGRLASVTDPLDRVTQFRYDSAGRVTTQIRPDSSLIQFAYDSAGNLTSLTPPGKPAHGFQYNAVGLVTQYDPPTIAAGAKPTKYFYNLDRQLDSIVRPDSITVALGYDAAGRPNAVTFDRGTLTLGYSSTTGNLNRIRTPEGDSLLFSYLGPLPTQVRWSGTVDGTVGVVYDNDFRVATQLVNGADSIQFAYDDDGLLVQAGALTLGRSTTNGLLLADTLGPVRSAYQYSTRGELAGYRVKHDTTTLFATGYVRDSLGRITQLFDTTQGTPTRWSFVYDSLGRLVKDSVNGAVFHAFTYDANGNRLSYVSGAGTVNYSYDNQDRLLWSRVGTDTTKYTYGSNGELKTKTVPGVGSTTYTYDALGNLIEVLLPDSTDIEYVIDGQNRRVGRKVNGHLVQAWLYQNQLNPVAELDSTGAVVSRFIYGSRANVPDYMIRGDSVLRLVTDHLGSVRLVVDTATGDIAQRLDYDEWGNVTTNTNLGFEPFAFGGGLYENGTKLVRFGARDHDPNVGRWAAKDPSQFGARSTNLYSYVDNDPVSWSDPTGLDFWIVWHRFLGFRHTFIWWQEGSTWDPSRFHVTFGAGPEGHACHGLLRFCLKARFDRETDWSANQGGCEALQLPDGVSEYEMLDRLFNLQAYYMLNWNDRIGYWDEFTGYNSNSYARGLAEAAGFRPILSRSPADWLNPVAPRYFGK